jgi:hypothetical protein
MLQSIARQQRVQLRRLLTPALAAQHRTAAAVPCILTSRTFSAAAANPATATAAVSTPATAAPVKGKGKKSAADAAAAAAAAESSKNTVSLEEEYNSLPPIPKPSAAELDALCLTEEQLRFASRPMPDASERHQLLPAVYVAEGKRISDHGAEDVGKYYPLNQSILSQIPSAIHRTMSQEYMGGGNYHMIRQPGLDLVKDLKLLSAGKPVARRVFGLRGASGTGKSASLHYAAQYLREYSEANPDKPWLIIATRGQEFSSEKRGFLAPSTVKPGVYDQALYTMDYFGALARSEEKALKLITIKRKDKLADVNWPEGQVGTTLFDLVTLASIDRAQAPRLLYEFVAELRLPTEVPVAIMIDNLNIWDQVCEFIEPHTYNQMDPRKLALVDAFAYFTKSPPVSSHLQYTYIARATSIVSSSITSVC